MKSITNRLFLVCGHCGVLRNHSLWPNHIKANVPFAFSIPGGASDAAGNYVINLDTHSGGKVVRLYNADTHQAAVAITFSAGGGPVEQSNPRLVFRCGDEGCALSEVWTAERRLRAHAGENQAARVPRFDSLDHPPGQLTTDVLSEVPANRGWRSYLRPRFLFVGYRNPPENSSLICNKLLSGRSRYRTVGDRSAKELPCRAKTQVCGPSSRAHWCCSRYLCPTGLKRSTTASHMTNVRSAPVWPIAVSHASLTKDQRTGKDYGGSRVCTQSSRCW